MDRTKQSIAWLCFAQGDMTIESMVRIAADIDQEAYLSELTHWVHTIQSGQAFSGATAWDGYMSLLVSDACIQSLHSGIPVAVLTPTKPGFYQARAWQGGADVQLKSASTSA